MSGWKNGINNEKKKKKANLDVGVDVLALHGRESNVLHHRQKQLHQRRLHRNGSAFARMHNLGEQSAERRKRIVAGKETGATAGALLGVIAVPARPLRDVLVVGEPVLSSAPRQHQLEDRQLVLDFEVRVLFLRRGKNNMRTRKNTEKNNNKKQNAPESGQ